MMYTRYRFGASLARGKRVLELGCGAGQGFRLVAREAHTLVGGDYSLPLLRSARNHYRNEVALVRLSAEMLPFRNGTFDLVLFFEASYYVPDMHRGFGEIARVLAPGGSVLFVNANPERPDFIRSPRSVHYHSADEFRQVLAGLGMGVAVEGAFPVDAKSEGPVARLAGRLFSTARRVLEAVGLVPGTLRGRARLKRLVYGKLIEVPAELPPDFTVAAPRVPVAAGPVTGFKVIYVTARKRAQGT